MSAYGTISRPSQGQHPLPLPSRAFPLKKSIGQFNALVFVHFHVPSAAFSGSTPTDDAGKKAAESRLLPTQWREKLYSTFQGVLEEGKTYPQYGPLTSDEFDSYYLSYDLVVGVLTNDPEVTPEDKEGAAYDVLKLGKLEDVDPERIGAFYYIKPNYPGRSSHLCNGGFVVPPTVQGGGVGTCAGRSFLYYAPRLGYRGSVFNLVYATNEASCRIWDNLGFDRVGRIPGAGKLVVTPDGSEEYVDAWVIYGDLKKLAPGVVQD